MVEKRYIAIIWLSYSTKSIINLLKYSYFNVDMRYQLQVNILLLRSEYTYLKKNQNEYLVTSIKDEIKSTINVIILSSHNVLQT